MFAPRSESMAHELGKVTGSLFSSYVFLQSPSAVVKYYPFYINAYYIELLFRMNISTLRLFLSISILPSYFFPLKILE